jgi:hypothetical protein
MTAPASPAPADDRAARDERLTELLADVELRVAAEDAAARRRPSP